MAAQRPRPTLAGPLLRGSGELHIVGRHELMTIADPDGVLHGLLELADGWRSRAEVLAALAASFPALLEHDAERALAELESIGLIEDATPRARLQRSRTPRRDGPHRAPHAESSRTA